MFAKMVSEWRVEGGTILTLPPAGRDKRSKGGESRPSGNTPKTARGILYSRETVTVESGRIASRERNQDVFHRLERGTDVYHEKKRKTIEKKKHISGGKEKMEKTTAECRPPWEPSAAKNALQ